MVKTELEGELHKSRSEEAALKDALVKMQALNEGLGQDKIELNRIIMQVWHALYHSYTRKILEGRDITLNCHKH